MSLAVFVGLMALGLAMVIFALVWPGSYFGPRM